MLVLVPHLFAPARLLEVAAQGLRLHALETVLARGTRQPFCGEGVEAALCQAFGIEKQQDWPLAPITLKSDGGAPGADYWLRADPVHLAVMRDRIVLADSAALGLRQDEADALADAIAAHFGPAFTPLPLQPQRWYLRLAQPPRLATTPLSCATGRDIDPLLPRGADAPACRAQLNELQMLLHAHPLNQARELRGQPAVNSLWLWGGGTLPRAQPSALRVAADSAEAGALADLVGAARLRRTAALAGDAVDLAVLDILDAAAQAGDAFAWRDGLRQVEAEIQALLGGGREFTLADPLRGIAFAWRGADRLKFWRRPTPVSTALRQD